MIGIEMAFAFQSMGCRTAVLEMEDRIAPLMDAEISRGLAEILAKAGVDVLTGAKVEAIEKGCVSYRKNGSSSKVSAQKVLVSTGRASNGLLLSLDRAGIAHQRGVIETDAFLRTNIPNIYAIGDVKGKFMLAHVASAEGLRAVENIAGAARPMDYSAVPQCIYTEPEAAAAGLTEHEAMKKGYAVQVSRIPVAALTEGCTSGFVKMVAEKSSGRILGAHILAPHASEFIAQCVSAIRYKATALELKELIYPHPTVSELILEASHGLSGHALHI